MEWPGDFAHLKQNPILDFNNDMHHPGDLSLKINKLWPGLHDSVIKYQPGN